MKEEITEDSDIVKSELKKSELTTLWHLRQWRQSLPPNAHKTARHRDNRNVFLLQRKAKYRCSESAEIKVWHG